VRWPIGFENDGTGGDGPIELPLVVGEGRAWDAVPQGMGRISTSQATGAQRLDRKWPAALELPGPLPCLADRLSS
jgi:hypothetical protein